MSAIVMRIRALLGSNANAGAKHSGGRVVRNSQRSIAAEYS